MNLEQYKILGAARVRNSFTTRELSDQTGVNINTVKTWLRRNPQFVERSGEKRKKVGGGAPSIVWRVRDDARDEIEAALLSGRRELRAEIVSQREAMKAFENENARLHVKRHLLLAASDGPAEREEHLAEARSWFAHESDRIAYWRRGGAKPPPSVQAEIDELRDQIYAFDLGVDRLSDVVELHSLRTAPRWIAATVDLWVLAPTCIGNPFHPLELAASSGLDKVELLHIIFEMSWRLARIPQERLLVAAIASLSFDLQPESRQIICDTLFRFDEREIGMALRQQLDNSVASTKPRRLFMEVFFGLGTWPRLLNKESVGAWFDSIVNSSAWHDSYAASYANCARFRHGKVFSRVVFGLREPLQQAMRQVENGDPNLINCFDDPPNIPRYILTSIRNWLNQCHKGGNRPTDVVSAWM